MSELNITVGKLEPTGEMVAIPQYAVSITFERVDEDGNKSSETVTALVPDFFLGLTEEHLNIVKMWLTEVLIANEMLKAEA